MANAVECKAPPRSSSMGSCITVPGNRMPCWLHSRQRAEHREALELRSQWSRETIRWSNTWRTQATHSKGNERRAGQPSPMRYGETAARPCSCGHRSWAKSEWNSLPFSTTGGMSPSMLPREGWLSRIRVLTHFSNAWLHQLLLDCGRKNGLTPEKLSPNLGLQRDLSRNHRYNAWE